MRGGGGGAAAEALRRIRQGEGGPSGLNAFLSLVDDADLPAPAGGGALAGTPVAVKDNLVTRSLPTTCGSRILEGYRSPFEATAVRRLREAGAVVVGKTNLDEFGMGSSGENSAYGPTLNPRDAGRVPGGSSSGSAAAVAAGYVTAALGSDTGGSVRQPASFCGVVGLKPTYGRVSRYGLVAFASSLDQVGTLGRRVADAAALLEVVAGHDPRDATSARYPVPGLAAAAGRPAVGGVVGVPREYLGTEIGAGVKERVEEALEAFRSQGFEVRRVSLPHTPFAVSAYHVLATAEASANLARYDGVRYGVRHEGDGTLDALYEETRSRGFGDEVKRRILLGTYVLSAGYRDRYHRRAAKARAAVMRDFTRVFADGVDVLFTPTSPTPAFRLGERTADPVAMYASDAYTVPASLAGIPAMSVPIGTVGGLPVGGQLMAPWWEEAALVRVGAWLEGALGGGGS